LLEEQEIPFRYREYRKEPLSPQEIRVVLRKLGVAAKEVLRTRDRAFKEAGLTGDEPEQTLIARMAEHPTLLQRPIGVAGGKAVIGRPAEKLLELVR